MKMMQEKSGNDSNKEYRVFARGFGAVEDMCAKTGVRNPPGQVLGGLINCQKGKREEG